MNKLIKLSLLQFAFIGSLMAQVPLNSSLGNLKKADSKGQEFSFYTDNGITKVTIYSPTIFRIRVEKKAFTKMFSYAVVANPEICNVKTSDSKDYQMIETDSLTLKVHKNPLRFSFYTKDGQLINTDDPSFGTSWLGDQVATYKSLQPDERFIGLGEHTGNLDRRGESYINYNTDNPGYNNGSKSLYASIPFYIGLHHNLNYGLFLDNSSRTTFSFGAGNNRFTSFTAECGEMNYYFIYHKNIRKIIESYTWLTGRMPMPPMWSLGYQQCRYSYFPDADLLSTAQKFRERNIPVDMFYLDIHYMDKYKLFTWDNERFPDPAGTINKLKQMSYHLAVIIDPGVKVEDNYDVYKDGLKSDIFVKYPDGTPYQGQVWPGWCHFPDFTMPKARTWWGGWFKKYVDQGITGFWNDMNEIAAWGQDVPKLLEFNWEGQKTSYLEAKNVFGMQMARSTFEGTKKLLDGKRPFVLTRSGYSGLQRYTSIWTGDNQSNEDHMLLGVRLINSMGLSGISFAGMDIGGFSGNPTPGLYTRWMEIGAFCPMFRGHTAVYTNRTEPWAFGEIDEDIVRRYIGFRYQLMPYIYSGFYESTQNGMPVARSLAIDYATDPNIYDSKYQQQYLFGQSIMVAPCKSTEEISKIYLPEGQWFDLFTDRVYEGHQSVFTESPIEKLPLFVRAGSIVPMQKLVETTTQNAGDTLFVHIYAGQHGSRFTYYEDDGETYKFTDGNFYKRNMTFTPENKTIEFSAKEGGLASKFKTISLVFHGFEAAQLQNLAVDGKPIKTYEDNIRFFVSNFKFADYGPNDTKKIVKASFQNSNDKLNIRW
ncbi:MAG: glycoside hydrolase family 31 protein [Bacteroidota bacterium]|nr:glycoside hydrolase family 31 protein [Bacteroidota bacterium]